MRYAQHLRWVRAASFAILAGFATLKPVAQAGPTFPHPAGFVTDTANVLSTTSRRHLEQLAADLERYTSAELALVIIPSLEGDSLERYTHELFNQWGIGKKGQDNGVLLLMAVHDRKVRIEVGYGIEPVLTDGRCGEIIRQDIAPPCKQGNYEAGLAAGVQSITALLNGDPDVKQRLDSTDSPLTFWQWLKLVAFILIILVFRLRLFPFLFFLNPGGSRRRRKGGGMWSGGGGFSSGGGFGGFGGGFSGGGGASGGW